MCLASDPKNAGTDRMLVDNSTSDEDEDGNNNDSNERDASEVDFLDGNAANEGSDKSKKCSY
jgi:hypothetical protein